VVRSVDPGRRDAVGPTARSVSAWLSLAAAPTFAVMAGATAIVGEGQIGAICPVGGMSALSGMTPMYLLMSAFHATPWLNLIRDSRKSRRLSDESAAARRSDL